MKKQLLKTAMAILLSFIVANVNAQVVTINSSSPDSVYVSDDFAISSTTLTDTGVGMSGSGWSDSWSYVSAPSTPMVINGSLSYPTASNIMVSGGSIQENSTGGNSIERYFTNAYELYQTTFYLSFLAQKDASGHFRLEGYGGSHFRYGLRIGASGTVEVRAGANWSTPSSAGVFANDKTYLVVLEKKGDESKIALFEEGTSIPTDPANVNWVVSQTGLSGVDMDKFRFVFSSETVKLDEIRLGSTLESVTQQSNEDNVTSNRNPEIAWGIEDNVDYYNIQLATDSLFALPVLNDTISSIVSRCVPKDELGYGDYFWRIRGRNKSSESWGEWRSTQKLTIEEGNVVQVNLSDSFSSIRSKVMNASSNDKIVLEQGTYSFGAVEVGSVDYLFKLNNKNTVEIDGNGSTIVFESDVDNIGILSADRSTNIAIRNLKVKREKKLHLPLKIVSVNTVEKSFICERISSEYPLPSEDPVQYENAIGAGWILDKETLKIKQGTTLSVLTDSRSGIYQGSQWKYYMNPSYASRYYVINNLAVGDIYLSGQKHGNKKEVNLTNCKNVTIYDFDTDNTGNTFAVFGEKCQTVSVIKCDWLRDKYQGPISDGVHFKDHRGGSWIEDNTIQSNGDDVIAIRTKNRSFTYVNATTLTISIYDDIEVGDVLHFVNGSAFNYLYEATVTEVVDGGSNQVITLDSPVLTASATNYNNYTLAAPRTMVRGNTFQGNRGEAFHLCIDGAVFEKNRIEDLGERVFTITPSEGGGTYSRNILIKDNEFTNVKRFDDLGDVDGGFLMTSFGSSSLKMHSNITFENNRCSGYPNMAISIKNATGVYVRDNIISSGEYIDTTIDFYGKVVSLDNTDNVFFENNTFVDFRNRPSVDYITATNSADFTGNNPDFEDQFVAKTWSVDEIGHSNAGTMQLGRTIPNRSLTYFSLEGEGKIDGNYSTDQLTFANVTTIDNCELKIKVDSLIVPSTTNYARAGLMLRESTATGSKYVMMSVREYNGNYYLQQISRSTDNTKLAVGATSSAISFPIYLKITRDNDNFTSYYSNDNITWTEFHQQNLPLNSQLLSGVAITSQQAGQTSTIEADELLITDFTEIGGGNARVANEEVWSTLEEESTNVKLYPNPANGEFYITTPQSVSETMHLQLFDISGRTVLSKTINAQEGTNSIDISTIKKGLYIVRLNSNTFNYVGKLKVQ